MLFYFNKTNFQSSNFTDLITCEQLIPSHSNEYFIFSIDTNYSYCLRGIVLNQTEAQVTEIIRSSSDNHKIVKMLKGKYWLILVDNLKQSLFITNDWLSKCPLYYYDDAARFLCSDSFFELVTKLQTLDITLTEDNAALYSLLKFGYLVNNITYINEIKYLSSFESIVISHNKMAITKTLPEKKYSYTSLAANVAVLDKLFEKALELQILRNQQLGLHQVITLSAGMDSRSVLLKSLKLGCKPDLCLTWAQTASFDNTVSKQIARDYELQRILYPLDDASCIYQIERGLKHNEGMQIYCGSTGALLVEDNDAFNNHPIIHAGLMGGELFSYAGNAALNYYTKIPSLPIFGEAVNQLLEDSRDLNHHEIDLMNNTRCCQNLIRQLSDYGTVFSPFLDEDLYEFMYFVPKEQLKNRKIYFYWMKKYMPNKYITTFTASKINATKITRFFNLAFTKIKQILTKTSRRNMNPFDYWYKTNSKLRTFLNEMFNGLIAVDKRRMALGANELSTYFRNSNCHDKCVILTYLETWHYIKYRTIFILQNSAHYTK